MTGHAMPWNKDKSGQQKEDEANARELTKKQTELQKQQETEIAQQRKKLNAQQIGMLRSRFGVSGGGGASGNLQQSTDTASSLFARITGR